MFADRRVNMGKEIRPRQKGDMVSRDWEGALAKMPSIIAGSLAIGGALIGASLGGPVGAILGATIGGSVGGYIGGKVQEKIEEKEEVR